MPFLPIPLFLFHFLLLIIIFLFLPLQTKELFILFLFHLPPLILSLVLLRHHPCFSIFLLPPPTPLPPPPLLPCGRGSDVPYCPRRLFVHRLLCQPLTATRFGRDRNATDL